MVKSATLTMTVKSLFARCSPSTIIWFIVSKSIDAIKRCLSFTKPLYVSDIRLMHVLIEVFKFLPTRAKFYSSTAISIIGSIVLVLRSALDSTPKIIERSFRLAMTKSKTIFKHTFFQTSATSSVPGIKMTNRQNSFIAARTKAIPKGSLFFNKSERSDSKLSKDFPGQVNLFHEYFTVNNIFSIT